MILVKIRDGYMMSLFQEPPKFEIFSYSSSVDEDLLTCDVLRVYIWNPNYVS
jgi:hypothetical protein